MAKQVNQAAMATVLLMMMLFAVVIGSAQAQVHMFNSPLKQQGALHDRHLCNVFPSSNSIFTFTGHTLRSLSGPIVCASSMRWDAGQGTIALYVWKDPLAAGP